MTNMTYGQALAVAIDLVEDEVVKERLEALKAQLAKRNSREAKPTKTQKENEILKEDMWAFIYENGAKRAFDIAGYFKISGQKASALLNALVKDGRLEKYTEKRVTYFRAVEEV